MPEITKEVAHLETTPYPGLSFPRALYYLSGRLGSLWPGAAKNGWHTVEPFGNNLIQAVVKKRLHVEKTGGVSLIGAAISSYLPHYVAHKLSSGY
jgi:hypothetical protein